MDVLVWWRRGFTPAFVPFEVNISFFADARLPREADTLCFMLGGTIMLSGDSPAFLGEDVETVGAGTSPLLGGRMLRDIGGAISAPMLLPAVLDAMPVAFSNTLCFDQVDRLDDYLRVRLVRAGLVVPAKAARADPLDARKALVDACLEALGGALPTISWSVH